MTLPFTLTSVAKVYPSREWRVVQDANGGILTSMEDYLTGVVNGSQVFQFERGDLVNVQLHVPDSLRLVQAGDTVIRIYNIVLDGRITTLRGELSIAEATLKASIAGDRPEAIAEAAEKLRFSEQELTIHEHVYQVQRQLLKDSVTSDLSFRTAENAYRVAQREVDVANKTLIAVKAGLKPEDIAVARANIGSLQQQIAFLERQQSQYIIKSPIKGEVTPIDVTGQMIVVQDRDRYLLYIPVRVEDLQYITDTSVIQLHDVVTQQAFTATKLKVLPKIQVLGGRQAVMLVASLVPPEGVNITTGLSMACTIQCGQLNQREYIKRMLNFKWTTE